MAKEFIKDTNFRPESLRLIKTLDEIIVDYQGQNLTLTLRQLYYQCITKNLFPNSERSYQNLSKLVTNARLAGLLDWDAIEDRVRQPSTPYETTDPASFVHDYRFNYRLPRWAGQEHYVELWVEKDALAGVLRPIAREYHITLMVNRGYSSASAMYEAAQRFATNCGIDRVPGEGDPSDDRDEEELEADRERYLDEADRETLRAAEEGTRRPHLLYLGDMDPSGEDMVRDVRDRLKLFGVEKLDVRKIALTMPQVEEHNPPPNPAKLSDSRAKKYVEKHGESSWEVDALPPQELGRLIRRSLDAFLDKSKMDKIITREKLHVRKLQNAVSHLSMLKDES